jgi:hypothetical protein
VPAIAGPWMATQAKCMANGKPCLASDSTAVCSYGGSLSIIDAGQKTIVM